MLTSNGELLRFPILEYFVIRVLGLKPTKVCNRENYVLFMTVFVVLLEISTTDNLISIVQFMTTIAEHCNKLNICVHCSS